MSVWNPSSRAVVMNGWNSDNMPAPLGVFENMPKASGLVTNAAPSTAATIMGHRRLRPAATVATGTGRPPVRAAAPDSGTKGSGGHRGPGLNHTNLTKYVKFDPRLSSTAGGGRPAARANLWVPRTPSPS